MVDHVTIYRLHAEANLQSLEQRRVFQLLKLLYDCSRDRRYLKITAKRTRAEAKNVFDIPGKCTAKFLNSPFYKGTQIWNTLPVDVQRAMNINNFSKHIRPMYSTYVDLLER